MTILDDLIDHIDYAKRYDNYITGLCPKHDDTRPSFFAYEDWASCKSCGCSIPTIKLLAELSNNPRLVKKAKPFHNPFTRWTKEDTLNNVMKRAWKNIKKRPSSYLSDRGIPAKTQIELGLGYLSDWYTFPIMDSKRKLIGAVARRGEESLSDAKYVVPARQDPNLLYVPSWERLQGRRELYLTFGILDAISLYLCGVAAVSTLSGHRLQPSALDKIRKLIYFIPDQGEEEAAHKIASKLGWRGKVMKVNWPDDSKDCNDLFRKHHNKLLNALGA
jgi:DNA primase